MSVAQRIPPMDDVREVSEEARERLSSARHRDIAFAIKRRIGERFSPDDVEMLVTIVVKTVSNREPLTQSVVAKYLKDLGRSPQKSEELAAALLK